MAFKYANYATEPSTLSICLGSLLIAARQLTFLYTPLAPERLQRFFVLCAATAALVVPVVGVVAVAAAAL